MAKSLRTPQHEKMQRMLAAARVEAKLTQTQLAAQLGRQQSFVAKYENGERRIDVIEFCDIAAALGKDPRSLLAALLD